MPAIWTTPRTWTPGELVTASIANSAWRDNFMYLKQSPVFDGNVTVTGTLTLVAGVLNANLVGNVTGNVTGNTTGVHTGNVVGGTISGTTGTFSGAVTVGTTFGVTGATTLAALTATSAVVNFNGGVTQGLVLNDTAGVVGATSIWIKSNGTATGSLVTAPAMYTLNAPNLTIAAGAVQINAPTYHAGVVAFNGDATAVGPSLFRQSNDLIIRGGTAATRFQDQAGANNNLVLDNAGNLVLVRGTLLVNSTATVLGTMTVNGGALTFGADTIIARSTGDGVDSGQIFICGGGAVSSTRGAYVFVNGNEQAAFPGTVVLHAGNVANGNIDFYTQNTVLRGRMTALGGFAWGDGVDPGSGNVRITGTISQLGSAAPNNFTGVINLGGSSSATYIYPNSSGGGCYFGLDNSAGTGFTGVPYAAMVYASPANGLCVMTSNASAAIRFYTSGGGVGERMRIHASGGISVASTQDPGAGNFTRGNPNVGEAFCRFQSGTLTTAGAGTAADTRAQFINANGTVGSITTNGTATAYNVSSDARLKHDRGLLTSTAVLQQTRIHLFDWIVDGAPGRGVFAQEAHTVAPFAVVQGNDETDDEGRLVNPWSVDYSKYVPDLVVGWQQHDARLAALEAAVMGRA